MVSKTIETSETPSKQKLVVTLNVVGKEFKVIKLYRKDKQTYDDALDEVRKTLKGMVEDGFPASINRKVKYLVNGQVGEETEELPQEN